MKLKFNDTAGQPFDTDHDSLGKPAAISCLGQMFAWLHFFYAWPPFGMQSREGGHVSFSIFSSSYDFQSISFKPHFVNNLPKF